MLKETVIDEQDIVFHTKEATIVGDKTLAAGDSAESGGRAVEESQTIKVKGIPFSLFDFIITKPMIYVSILHIHRNA